MLIPRIGRQLERPVVGVVVPGDFLFGNFRSRLLIRIRVCRWSNKTLDNLRWLLVGCQVGIDSDRHPFGIQALWSWKGPDAPDIENVDSDSAQTAGAASRSLERSNSRNKG